MNTYSKSDEIRNRYRFSGIFSDVDINFNTKEVSTVTSLTLDSLKDSRRSSTDLPTQIKQLLIDIQAIDDSEIARVLRNNPNTPYNCMQISERMPRFTKAFNQMFENLIYNRVENSNGHKAILFKKYSVDVPIDALSSGEKQIVFRGCFLLKDINALSGAFVFIDEPEISLHPSWQNKIMDFYKSIFTNESGQQTSQIFVVTHSPFIIHNVNRKNDKVIVLSRNEAGDIIVKDNPEYYKCDSIEVIQDAFSIHSFSSEMPTVYLEGRTDEMYFNKVLEVYNIKVPFQFKWIGYIDAKGREANTGKDSLNKAASFLISRNLSIKNICLYDCDTNKPQEEVNNVITISIPKYENDKEISVGIENALVFGDIDVDNFKNKNSKYDGYGCEKTIQEFQKMECCKYICSLDTEKLKDIFINLKSFIYESIFPLMSTEERIN
jgi:energy-coupling factor transporter ATP-binding protein EcfA2